MDWTTTLLLRSYEAGASDGWGAAKQPEMRSTPQRQAPCRRIFAVRTAIAIWRPSLFNMTGTLWNIAVAWRPLLAFPSGERSGARQQRPPDACSSTLRTPQAGPAVVGASRRRSFTHQGRLKPPPPRPV